MDPLAAIESLLGVGKMAIERIWPDPMKQAEELRKLQEMAQTGDLAKLDAHVKIILGQLEINKAQANHKSIFVAGARPFIIWVGGTSLAYAGLVHPLLTWIWAFAEMSGTAPPMVEPAALGTILSALLGVAGMRSHDKKHGVQTDSIG